MKRLLLSLLLLAPLVAGAVVLVRRLLTPLPVRAAPIVRGPALATVFATGWIEARERRLLRPPRPAIVGRIFRKEGEEVRAGEPLVELRDTAREQREERVRAELDQIAADLAEGSSLRRGAEARIREATVAEQWAAGETERARPLYEQKLLEQRAYLQLVANQEMAAEHRRQAEQELAQTLEQRQTQQRQLSAELETLHANTKDDRIVAPFDGVVLLRFAEEGESVNPERDLMKFGDLRDLLVEGEVDEEDVARVRVGQRVLIRLAGDLSGPVKGEVVELFPDANRATRSFRVRVRFVDAAFVADGALGLRGRLVSGAREIVAGTSVELGIVVEEKSDALVSPRAALTARGTLFVLKEGRAQERRVEVGIRNFDRCEVTSGAAAGELVAIEKLGELDDGRRVEAIVDDESGKAAAARALAAAGHGASAPPASVGATPAATLAAEELGKGPVDLLAARAPATVLLFTRADCPISNKFAPEVARLCERWTARGVAWFLVYVDPAQSDESVRAHMKDYGCGARVLLDRRHELVKRLGATITPEAALLARDGSLAYLGRIDDRFADVNVQRSAPTTHDLDDALAAVVAGRTPAQARTTAIGCVIEDLR